MAFDVEEYAKKRRQNSTDKKDADNTSTGTFDVEEYAKQRNLPQVGEYLTSSINEWLKKNEDFFTSYNNKVASRDSDPLKWSYEADSEEWFSSITTQKSDLENQAKEIRTWLDQYKDYLDKDYYNSVVQALDGNLKVHGDILTNATEDYKYWSEFKTEDAYNEYIAGQIDYNEKLNYDLGAGKAEIEKLQGYADMWDEAHEAVPTLKQSIAAKERELKYGHFVDREKLQKEIEAEKAQLASYESVLSQLDGRKVKEDLSQKQAYYTLAERAQKAAELASVADVNSENYDVAFAEKSQYQSTKFTPENFWDRFHSTEYDLGYDDLTHEYINGDEDFRSEVRRKYAIYSRDNPFDDGKSRFEEAGYDYMEDDEIAIYNYYYNTEGKEKAEEYLDSLAETLQYRYGAAIAGGKKGRPISQFIFAVEAGLDQFGTGIASIFSDEYQPASATQVASGIIREDLADTGAKLPDWLGGASLGQAAYDSITTTSNMLPSILASAAMNYVLPGSGAIVGAGLLGASAGGNAKVEMLNLGYSKEQAKAYGAMVAASEAGLQYLLGGITKLGGASNGLTELALSKVDNAFARVAIQLGGSMLSEGFEEGLQTVIEPWLKEVATGVDWESATIDEVLYSGLLGALSAFGLEGGSTVAGAVNTYKSGKNVQKVEGGVAKLQEIGKTFSADTVAYKIASKVNAQTDAYTIGRLLSEVNGTLSEQNVTEIANGLMERGIDSKTANKLAKQYQSFLNNEMSMSEEQVKILENLSPLADVLRKKIIGANTTVYQRTRAYSDLMNLADEVANGKKGVTTVKSTTTARPSTNIFEQQAVNTDLQRLASEVATGSRTSMAGQALKKSVDSASAAAEEKLGVEGKYTSNNTGATRLASNNKKVDIVGVDSIAKDGTMKLKLNDGSIVDAAEISFSTSDQAIVYEAVANMGVSANTAWEILKGYDPKSNQKGTIYAMGALEAYTYGHNGVKVDGMSKDGFSALLSPTQKNTAHRLGDIDARAKVEAQQKTIDKAVKSVRDEAKSKHKAIPKRNGEVVFEGKVERLTEHQQSQIDVLDKVAEGLGVTFHIFASEESVKGKRSFRMPDGTVTGANGWYNPETGEIWIDIHAGNFGQGAIIFTAAHELTHFIRQWSPTKFKVFADFLMEQYGKKGQDVNQLVQRQIEKAAANNRTIGWDEAYEEVVADSCETFLRDSKAAEKVAALREKDAGLANKIKTFLGQMLAKMRKVLADLGLAPETPEGQMVAEMTDSIQKLYNLWTDALADAGQAYSTVGGEIDLDGDSNVHKLSDRTMIEGAGLQFIPDEDGVHYQVLDDLGNSVKSVTPEMIAKSPLGQLVASAKDNGFLGEGKAADSAAKQQYKFLAELVNMCINYDGLAPIWETAGTMVFSSIKSNADKQYGLTIDFSTVCKKTQAIVDAMSEAMVRLGRGLTRSEVETLYLEVGKAGESTPCPVCYVFSRWMGIGGILDQMSRFQDKYTNMSESQLQAFITDIKKRITERANTPNKNGVLKKDFFDKNGAIKEGQVIADLKQKANSGAGSTLNAITKNSDTQLQIQELKALMENQDAKEAKKTATKIKKLEAKLVDVSALEKQFKEYNDSVEEYEAYQWLTRTLMEEVDGKWVKNKQFKPVPKDVLFDLNKGATFAEDYPLSWAFRTGKGASAGKAITPYADARVGEAIQGIASQDVKNIKTGIDLNPFLNGDEKTRQKIIASAIEKQARQNLIGGQRYQSTSDFRYEYGSDYLITFMEMQAIGAKVQLYTKVIEAVDFLASMGADINLSVMPLSDGYVTLPNGKKKLIYSSVTGIDAEAAIKKSHEYNNVQLILVGISDEHIRLALEGDDITFVIPFHGSGNSVHQIQALMNLLGENLDVTTAQDYTAVQSDHVSPKQTKEQKAMWDLRVKILTGKASTLSASEFAILDKNAYLKDLYNRFYLDENADEFGINLSKDVAEQIFPYEYWDKSLTYAEADKNGERFKEYCASMGIIPRFSGMNSKGESVGFGDFTNNKGYWKLLIDRPMYDNTYDSNGNWTGYGKYHEQQRINCSNFQVKHLDPEYGSATYGEVMSKANDPKKTNMIVDRAIAQFENAKFSDRTFSYNELVAKGDLQGIVIDKNQQVKLTSNGSIDLDWVLKEVRNKCKILQTKSKNPTYYVKAPDLGENVEITRDGIKHGFIKFEAKNGNPVPPSSVINARIALEIPSLLNNSIEVNRSQRSINPDILYTSVLIGTVALEDSNGNLEYYAVRSMIEHRANQNPIFVEANVLGKLYATKAKKIGLPTGRGVIKNNIALASGKTYAYSIADFLQDVKGEFDDTFSLDVYQQLGTQRAINDFSANLLYSDRDSDHSQAALEEFGTTSDIEKTGFVLADGRQLNLSPNGFKGVYHNQIARVYDNLKGGEAVNRFIQEGNVRVKASSPGIEISADKPLTISQYNAIGGFIQKSLRSRGVFYVDITDADGKEVASITYEENHSSEDVKYDIKKYYEKGWIPTPRRFYFSDRSPNSVSTRSLLANALESTAQNDIERNKLAQYKSKIELIESEYAKLTEIKKQANEIRFTKGRTAAETKQMKALEFEANQIANRINTYDRQLLNLESTTALKNVLQREKELARRKEAQKGKQALAKAREKAAKTERELLNRASESRKKAIESRNKTEMRGKIKKVVGDLKTLLLKETKDKHVPIGLQKPVAEALDIINMDTVGADERVAKYNEMIHKSKDPDIIAELTKSRDRIALQGENLSEKLNALKQAYADIKNSDDPLVKQSHDEAIETLIHNTATTVGNTSLRNMSYEQLEAVYDMYKAILASVRNANKMFKAGKQETITDNSEAVKNEVREIGGHRDRVLKATKWLKKFGWNMLKPIYAMKLIGSDTFTGLYENVRRGEDTWAVDVSEAKDFFKETASKYKYDSWDFKKQYTFNDSVGNSFSLSIEQIMSLYAYSKRAQADKHLEIGGFIFDDAIEVVEKKHGIPMVYEVNDANPYRLKKEDLGNIISILGTDLKDVKGFVDEMQAYLSDVMGAKGNEVSLAMYDIKLYKEQHYFPLKSAKYFREFDPEQNGTPKIKNSSFSKKTVPQAGNPIVLSNFMDVWAKHVNDMSMYHAFTLPLEDFMRVYNYSSTAGGYDSVQQYIKNAYGMQANAYIETLMNDLNGGARTDPAADIFSKGISLFKKGAVFASASVVIQQPSAIGRALAYIDAKYFIDKPEITKHSETWAEVKKYAPVAIIKEMGYFDTGMGQSTIDWIKEEKTWRDKIDDVASKAPALADELAWCGIWKAIKREIAATTDLEVGSEEFLKKAGERFTDVITRTQVYDSVLSRSAMMRSKDTGMKMATAFMAEPTTSINMAIDAIIEGKRGNKAFARKAIGAVAASIILNSVLVSLVYAARDDDDDETYTEKYLESLTTELLEGFNPITYIPFFKDVWSIAQGFDVERSDMSIVGDLWEAVENLFNDSKSGYAKVEGLAGSVATMFGLPLKNVLRDTRGVYNLISTLVSGTPTTWAGVGDAIGGAVKNSIPLYSRIERFVGADESKSDKLYDAIISGDQKQIDRVKGQYKDDKAIETAIKQGLRENDSRIHEAAKARLDGDIDEYKRIAKEIIAEGNFSQDTVVAAINSEMNAIEKGEVAEETPTTEDDIDKVTSIYKASDINSAFENGDTDMALEVIDDLLNTKVENYLAEARKEAEKNGKTFNERKARKEAESKAKASIKSSMTSYWKPLYKEAYKSGNTAEKERIERILKASGLYGTASEVIKTCREWRAERD